MNAQQESHGSSIFSDEEIKGIREGIGGVKRSIPARFYYDEALYRYEVEHLLKKTGSVWADGTRRKNRVSISPPGCGVNR